MTNPKEKRETLEYKISRLLLTITIRNYRLAKIEKITPEFEKEDERTTAIFLEGIKEIIKQAFEETRGDNLEETIKRQEDYLNNL